MYKDKIEKINQWPKQKMLSQWKKEREETMFPLLVHSVFETFSFAISLLINKMWTLKKKKLSCVVFLLLEMHNSLFHKLLWIRIVHLSKSLIWSFKLLFCIIKFF